MSTDMIQLIVGIFCIFLAAWGGWTAGYSTGKREVEMGPIHAGHYKKGFDDGRDYQRRATFEGRVPNEDIGQPAIDVTPLTNWKKP